MRTLTSRREFLALTGAACAVPVGAADTPKRLKVAAVFTEFTYRSHAHVILENFLEPYIFNGKRTDPGMDVVSFFADQTPKASMADRKSTRLNSSHEWIS